MKRVLHITDYAADYEGAFIRQLRMLDEELRARGAVEHSAIALTPVAIVKPWADRLRQDGWQLYEVPPTHTWGSRDASRALKHAMSASDCDVAHVHFGTYELASLRAAKRIQMQRDMRLVWHYRTALEEPLGERSMMRRAKDWWKYSRSARKVDACVGVTRAMAEEVAARGMGEVARPCVAGCDTDRFQAPWHGQALEYRQSLREELGVKPDEHMILHMGWHWHRKGGDLLAAAMDILAERGVTGLAAFSIAPPDGVELGSIRTLPATDSVHRYHQASDIFISASRSEGFGNGLIEAMACGRVAVAACAAGQVETFDGLGSVTPVGLEDPVAIADGIEAWLARQDEWREHGEAAREHVLTSHSMRRWASNMADIYNDIGVSVPAAKNAQAGVDAEAPDKVVPVRREAS